MEVLKDTCEANHRRVDENMDRTEKRLNDHSGRLDSVEDAVLKLTIMVEGLGKKSIFDKILAISVLLIAIVLLFIVAGPEIAGKIIGGVIK